MATQVEDTRREIMMLLRQQMRVLDSGAELTDSQLRECYDRQVRVQELREKLQASGTPEICRHAHEEHEEHEHY
jgi:hypothetical protein